MFLQAVEMMGSNDVINVYGCNEGIFYITDGELMKDIEQSLCN